MALSNEIDLSVEQLPQNPIVLTPQDETDYNSLINKPKINNVALVGNKTSSELGLASDEQGAKADSAVQPDDLSVYRTSADQDIIDATKQDTITDLATIRSGASAGATAVQPADLSVYRTSADQDIIDATKVSKAGDTMTGPLKMSGENEVRFGTDDNFYYVTKSSIGNLNFMKGDKGLFLSAADAFPHYTDGTNGYRMITTADFQQGLSGKADTNLGNLSTAGKDIMSASSLPTSTNKIKLTAGSSGALYTAPANGWFIAQSNGSWIIIQNQLTDTTMKGEGQANVLAPRAFVPALKNQKVYIYYDNSISWVYFLYAEGAE